MLRPACHFICASLIVARVNLSIGRRTWPNERTSVEKTEKIKEGLEQKKEAFTDLSNKKAQSINEKLVLCHSS